ncbi:LpxL/LpxP family acyltransferase [Escherichia coli]
MTRVVEAWVRENPGQWLWMHRRWRPDMIRKQALTRSVAHADAR